MRLGPVAAAPSPDARLGPPAAAAGPTLRAVPESLPACPLVHPETAARWVAVHGALAREWLGAVPRLVETWAARWDLELAGRLEGGSMSVVVAATGSGSDVVLKLAAPWAPRPGDEAAALATWAGDGAVELLGRSLDGAVILLERVSPGSGGDALSAGDVGELCARLASPPPPPGLAPMAAAVAHRFARAGENRHRLLTAAQLAAAERAAQEWAARYAGPPALVHGDFLAKNVLRCARRGWVAIDPTPWAGDPSFDLALWALTTRPVEAAYDRLAALGGPVAARAGGWVPVLAAVEACLASPERARASLRLAADRRAAWLEP